MTPYAQHLTPHQLLNQLGRLDARILDHLTFLARNYQRRAKTSTAYCWPGRRWLAERAGCSIRSVTRATTHLRELAVIRRIQRRPELGRWNSNIYVILGRLGHVAGTALARQLARLNRGPGMAHKPPLERGCVYSQTPIEGRRPPPAPVS